MTAREKALHRFLCWAICLHSAGSSPPSLMSSSRHLLQSFLGRPTGLLPRTCASKIFLGILSSSIRATCPAHVSLLDLMVSRTFGWPVISLISALCRLLHWLVSWSYTGPVICLSTLFSKTSNLFSKVLVRDQVSHPYTRTGFIMVLYVRILVLREIDLLLNKAIRL